MDHQNAPKQPQNTRPPVALSERLAILSGQRSGIITAQPIIPLPSQPRARGEAQVTSKARPGQGARPALSVISTLRQAGSSKLVFPRVPVASGLQAVLVNTAGGITGGDRFSLSATAGPDTHLTLTTQAAERAYGAQPGETGRLRNRLTVAQGARLDWLPQETILFENSRLRRDMHVDLAPDARLLFVESLVLGRALMGEALHAVTFHDRVEIRRDGVPIFLDALLLSGDADAHMAQAANGAGALASVVFAAPEAEGLLDPIRAALAASPTPSGASLLAPDLLHLRLLAPDSFGLRKALIPALTLLSQGPLPRTWMI